MSNHQLNQDAGISEHPEEQDSVSIHIGDMLSRMTYTSPEHIIFRVHHQLRELNANAYDPEILAIGPYHYGNDKFKSMEEQKLRHLQQLLERRGEENVDRYMPTLRDLEQQARECYADINDLSQQKFLAMMLIDGCFIVELFRKCTRKIQADRDDPLMKSDWFRYYLHRDLLLVENQLPLFVLSSLYPLIKRQDETSEFSKVAIEFFDLETGGPGQNFPFGECEHLLHLYHALHTSDLPDTNQPESIPVMLSAIELMESGVRFRAVQGGQLTDIKFKNGTLKIPVLQVEDDTESKFRNLIAYEQHRQGEAINYFTDYVDFIDRLINSSKDVEVLRRKGIIKSYLGDDKVIAQMFNKMCDNVSVSGSCSYYSEIFQNVNVHCRKRRNVWMAKLRREYFHSPWAFLSVLAAIVLLLLTAAQTVFTIYPYKKQS